MKPSNRIPLLTLGLICLMPALFFWVVNSTPVDLKISPISLICGESYQLELLVCGIIFPVIAVFLGWLALRGNNRKRLAWFVLIVGLIETAAGLAAAVFF